MSLDEFLDAAMFASIVIVMALAFMLAGFGHLLAAVFRLLAFLARRAFTPPKWWCK